MPDSSSRVGIVAQLPNCSYLRMTFLTSKIFANLLHVCFKGQVLHTFSVAWEECYTEIVFSII